MSDFNKYYLHHSKIIADKITYKRGKKRISQSELAKKTGLSLSTIKRVESGYFLPNNKTLMAILYTLDIALSTYDFTMNKKKELPQDLPQ
jgi:transcriptional regulator with XRE-family HTH domain